MIVPCLRQSFNARGDLLMPMTIPYAYGDPFMPMRTLESIRRSFHAYGNPLLPTETL